MQQIQDMKEKTRKLFELIEKQTKDKKLIKFIQKNPEVINLENKYGETSLMYALKKNIKKL